MGRIIDDGKFKASGFQECGKEEQAGTVIKSKEFSHHSYRSRGVKEEGKHQPPLERGTGEASL